MLGSYAMNGWIQGVCIFIFLSYFYVFFVEEEEHRLNSQMVQSMFRKRGLTPKRVPNDHQIEQHNQRIVHELNLFNALLVALTIIIVWYVSMDVRQVVVTAVTTLILVGVIKVFFLFHVALKYRKIKQ